MVTKAIKEAIKVPMRKVVDSINDYNKAMIMASVINKELKKYKGINRGKDIYIVGGGPSVKNFEYEKKDSDVFIGINRAFKDERFEFDYLFVQDQLPEGFDDFLKYRGGECKKFMGIICQNVSFGIQDYKLQGEYERYVLASRVMKTVPIDITLEPFADLKGTAFSALQFAIYTDPQRIFLVGMDCDNRRNVYNKNEDDYRYQFEGWEKMKIAMTDMGVCDRVYSINPVGLKGMFKDI